MTQQGHIRDSHVHKKLNKGKKKQQQQQQQQQKQQQAYMYCVGKIKQSKYGYFGIQAVTIAPSPGIFPEAQLYPS